MLSKTTDISNEPKKLRILCFHGYADSADILRYLMRNVMTTFDTICEFEFIDGPFVVNTSEPIA